MSYVAAVKKNLKFETTDSNIHDGYQSVRVKRGGYLNIPEIKASGKSCSGCGTCFREYNGIIKPSRANTNEYNIY